MRNTLVFGRIAGIPLKLHLNWFLVAVLVTWSLASGYFPQQYPGWGSFNYWFYGSFTALLFFVSVLIHELGHSMVALREDVPVNSITLFIFGGVAHIANEPPTPRSEFRIVLAGPLASLFLGGVFKIFSMMSFLGPQVTASALYLYQINIILAVFNLIPGFPLDGGRILRSFLWKLKDDFCLATRWASNTGLAIALLFVGLGVALMLTGNLVSGIWMAFIGWYLSTAAQEGYRQAIENNPANPVFDPIGKISLPRPVVSPDPHPSTKTLGKDFALAQLVEQPQKLPFVPKDGRVHDSHQTYK